MPSTKELKEQVRVAREVEGLSLYAIMDKFSIKKSTAYALIRDMDASKVSRASPTRRVVHAVTPLVPRPPLSKSDLGEAARQMIAARLMLGGFSVYKPLGEDTPVDLLVLHPKNGPLKIQCKCAYVAEDGSHRLNLTTTRKWGPSSKAIKHQYTNDEVDFFIGYITDTDSVYVLPWRDVHTRTEIKLWLLRQPQGVNDLTRFDPEPYRNAFHLLSP